MGAISPPRGVLGTDTEGTGQTKEVNALTTLINEFNGNIDAANIANGVITQAKLATALQQLLVPTGSILMTGGTTADSGFLLCDGSAVLRATYPALFTRISTQYGVGDGSTTFNVPNLQQRFPLGKSTAGIGVAMGETGGAIDHVHSMQNHFHDMGNHTHGMQNHNHDMGAHFHGVIGSTGTPSAVGSANSGGGVTIPDSGHTHSMNFASGGPSTNVTSGPSSANTGGPSGNNTSGPSTTNTTGSNPPYLVVWFQIKT